MFPVTFMIIIVTVIASLASFNNRALFDRLKHHPYSETRNKEWYRLVSSGFIHADYVHLGLNMFVLYMFGKSVEHAFGQLFMAPIGSILYLLLYIATTSLASVPSLLKHKDNAYYSAIGASGAVSGVLMVWTLISPWATIQFIFLPFFNIYAVVAMILYLAYSQWAAKQNRDNIGHDAHYWGAIAGGVIAIVMTKFELLEIFLAQVTSPPFLN